MTPEPCFCRLQGWDVFFFFAGREFTKKKKNRGRRVGDEKGQGEDAPATRPAALPLSLLALLLPLLRPSHESGKGILFTF